MDEQEIQQKRRDNEEQATAQRAQILALPYLDTREFESSIPLVDNLLDVPTMRRDYILPLQKGICMYKDASMLEYRLFCATQYYQVL